MSKPPHIFQLKPTIGDQLDIRAINIDGHVMLLLHMGGFKGIFDIDDLLQAVTEMSKWRDNTPNQENTRT